MTNKTLVNLVFIGHVDHGKSTLIGRTLVEACAIKKNTFMKLEDETSKLGKDYAKYAWLIDRLRDERERDQTIDIAYRFFETENKRLTIIDTPGHRDFVGNMVTGASQADVGVLVVSASLGQFEAGIEPSNLVNGKIGGQTREHAFLSFIFGIRQLIVTINKMDSVEYSQKRFEKVKNDIMSILKQIGFQNSKYFPYIPISAFYGENVSRRSQKMPWYSGHTFFEALNLLRKPDMPTEMPLRMPIIRTFNVHGVGVVPAGKIISGVLEVNDNVIIQPSQVKGVIRSIEMFYKPIKRAMPGDNVGVCIRKLNRGDAWKGCVIGHLNKPPTVTNRIKGKIVIREHPAVIRPGYRPILYCHTEQVESYIETIESLINPETGEVISIHPDYIKKGDIAIVWLSTIRPIVMERMKDIPSLSNFILRDMGTTVAAGICVDLIPMR